jgi:medium-chain acyl-[acyl-carrier-protein] hydrolase
MEQYSLETSARLTTADVDMEGRLKPGTLVGFLVQSAISSADDLGFGFDNLKEQSLFWVLHRLTVEILRPVMWNETIRVETWPKDIDGLFYIRDFMIRDGAGQVVAQSTSGWLAVNRKNKRPAIIDTVQKEKFSALKDRHAIREFPGKLNPVPEGHLSQIQPSWYDFDINRHVTSSRYIDWMMDTLPFDFHRDHYPQSLSVNFLKEVLPGETIRLIRHDEASYCHFEGTKETTEKCAFRGLIRF